MAERAGLAALLKSYRLAAGLSQEALAERAGLSARSISDLERGLSRQPRFETLDLLAGALSLSQPERALLRASARPELPTAAGATPLLALPVPPTALIGREAERSAALALLRSTTTRLLTLTGPSGVGKTRLALQLAQDLAAEFGDGGLWVEAAPIRDAALLPHSIAQSLGLREGPGSSVAEQVRTFLLPKRFLLVLDNLEQIPESAAFVASLLANCPHLALLVTSRTPLRLRAEQELLLAPLPLADAVALFRERAQAVRPVASHADGDVAAICEQLDRLPLAIELAARHVNVLQLSELRLRLDHRFALLRDGARDLPARQQTMEDAIAWSYELLGEEQRRFFRCLGVFVGGWTVEAAEEICRSQSAGPAAASLLTLSVLVDASLVYTEMPAGEPMRFGMLELMREFAWQRLQAAGEEESCRRRHAGYYARLAEKVNRQFGPDQGSRDTQSAFAREGFNVRAALEWALARHEAELGLRLTDFTRLWQIRGQNSEAEDWLGRVLALDAEARNHGQEAAPATLRLEKLNGFARALLNHGKMERAAAVAGEALQLAQSIGDKVGLSNAFATLGLVAQASERLDQAAVAFAESRAAAKLAGHTGLENRALVQLAEVARLQGNLARAATLLDEALATAQAGEMAWDVAVIATMLGHVARQQQRNDLAKARYREALTIYHSFGSPTYTALCLEGLAATLAEEGRFPQAVRLSAAAAALRARAQTPLPPAERAAHEQVLAVVRTALGEAAFAQAWSAGHRLGQDDVLQEAFSDARP